MSLWSRIRAWLGPEPARSRPTGEIPGPDASDTYSTTGATPNDAFAGSASGDGPGEVESPASNRAGRPLGPQGEAPDGYTDPEIPASRQSRETGKPKDGGVESGGA